MGADGKESMNTESLKRKRLGYLACGAITLLMLGLVYGWSIFATPLGDAFGWDRSLLSYTFSISMTAFCTGALVGSFIVRRSSTRMALLVAALLQAAGFILTSFLAVQGIWVLYICYGICAGLGCGIGYNTIISTVNLWFPDRLGLASGVLMMSFGMGSLILGTLANALMGALGWGTTFVVIGVLSAAILSTCALVLKSAPKNVDELAGAKPSLRASQDLETRPMLKTPYFYLFFFWAVLLFGAVMTLMGDSKQGALALGVDPAFATVLVGLVSMMNGLARVVIGAIYDKTNLSRAMLVTSLVGVVAIGGIAHAFFYGIPNVYLIAALLAGFTAGGVPVMSSAFTRERFGAKDYARNLAIVNFSITGSALVSAAAVAIGRPLGGDVAIYLILLVLVAVALVDAFVFFSLYKRGNQRS